MAWRIRRGNGRKVKVVGEYQGEEFHSSDEARSHDEARFADFRSEGYLVEELWNDDLTATEARHLAVLRFAEALEVPAHTLSLSASDLRFFSSNMVELAELRARRRRAREWAQARESAAG